MQVRENIIDEAVRKSIGEFMLNEGFGDAAKSVMKGLGSVANSAFKAWVDWGTNGEWSRRFGGNQSLTKSNEIRLLNQWFNFQRKKIIYYNRPENPSTPYEEYEKVNPNRIGGGKDRFRRMEKMTASQYILKYCSSNNFNAWISQYIKAYGSMKYICHYIDKYIYANYEQRNIQKAINNCNIVTFLMSREGKVYMSLKKVNRDQNWEADAKKKAEKEAEEKARQEGPVPTNPDGTFSYGILLPNGWATGKDKNGRDILVNPKNPKQAKFA